ncbi:hypothetical protein [Granulicella paludicola]|uniref:hypothetical protein n=1 Tax=Granulicella paludicola TaxID=474951 RepID=UPI0021DFFF61|nr:hypothetical protein [Granulicella paludicola]
MAHLSFPTLSIALFLVWLIRRFVEIESGPSTLQINLQSKDAPPARRANSPVALQKKLKGFDKTAHLRFMTVADARVGTFGVLIELRQVTLLRVEGYSCDEWGAMIEVTPVMLPGFRKSDAKTHKISSVWGHFHTDQGRWQARYCWKVLFGATFIQAVIAAGAEASERSMLLTQHQIFKIHQWARFPDAKKAELYGFADLPGLMKYLFDQPLIAPLPRSKPKVS